VLQLEGHEQEHRLGVFREVDDVGKSGYQLFRHQEIPNITDNRSLKLS
jgi:hypothetical protein